MDLLLFILMFFGLILFASSVLSNQKKQIQSNARVEEKLEQLIGIFKNETIKK